MREELTSFIKPPIGISPKCIWDNQRFGDLKDAILRYVNANRPIPEEWVKEYNELQKVVVIK